MYLPDDVYKLKDGRTAKIKTVYGKTKRLLVQGIGEISQDEFGEMIEQKISSYKEEPYIKNYSQRDLRLTITEILNGF